MGGLNDLKNIRRDSLLIYILAMPWLIVFLIRFVVPSAARYLALSYNFALEPYYPLILSFFVVLEVPMMFGVVFGLLLLDEKDSQILKTIQVTPVSVEYYLRYRFILAAILSALFVIITLPLTGLVELSILVRVIPLAASGGIFTVLVMQVLIRYAGNKVEGLAITKAFGILMLGPLAAYFIDSNLQFIFGILPSYWLAKSYWLISEGLSPWLYLFIGFIYMVFLIKVIYKKF